MDYAPIKHTCPDINKVIKWLNAAIDEANNGLKIEDIDDIKATFKEILYHLDGIESLVEDLRDSNSELRDWGNDLYERNQELEQQLEDLL